MTMFQSTGFNYAGVDFESLGVYQCAIEMHSTSVMNGLYTEQLLPDGKILETQIRTKDTPYLQGVQHDPLQFTLTFGFNDATTSTMQQIVRAFYQVQYQPFYTTDNPNRIWYALATKNAKITHNGSGSGYVEIDMRCDTPFSWTPQVTSSVYDYSNLLGLADPTTAPTLAHTAASTGLTAGDYYVAYSFTNANGETKISPSTKVTINAGDEITVSAITLPSGGTDVKYYASLSTGDTSLGYITENTGGVATNITTVGTTTAPPTSNTTDGNTTLTVTNTGDWKVKPEIWVTREGRSGDISIINTSNSNAEFKFTGLDQGEQVYVDNENEYIQSSESGVYRYDAFNDNYMEWVVGDNVLKITGACQVQFRYQFPLLQG